MQMDILLHVCIIFKISNKLSYFRIQQIKLSFIHIRILILQNFSLSLICEIFNIIDQTRILNFIICICIKLHILREESVQNCYISSMNISQSWLLVLKVKMM